MGRRDFGHVDVSLEKLEVMLGVKWKIDLKKEEICYMAHTSDFSSETKLCFFLM